MPRLKNSQSAPVLLAFLLMFCLAAPVPAAVTSPESFLGFKPGTDRKIADWVQITGYFQKLSHETARVQVTELGKTTEGRPFLQVLISSENNLANLARYKDIEARLADSRRLSDPQAEALAREGKIFVGISCSIHSTEIAASQMSMQLAYELVTGQFPDAQAILDNIIIVLFPSSNPDGIQIVSDWYRQQLGTPYEGTSPPFLYHKYAGHDNNRDFFKLTQVETRMLNRALWREWHPAIYWDIHQMGSNGARLFVPPYSDPTNPNIDPIIIRELFTLGGYMTGDLAIEGKKGVMTMDRFDAWWIGGNRITPWYHNSVGILTEAASARIATPIEISPEHLSGRGPGESYGGEVFRDPRNFLQNSFNLPNPWPGGTWRLQDIVDYEMIAAHGLLRAAATDKNYFLMNFYRVSRNTVQEGTQGHPFAYVIPRRQHDEVTAVEMINLLIAQGVEVFVSTNNFGADGKSFEAGSYIIPLNQPYGRLVKTLFETQRYPDRRTGSDNTPERPYDVTGWTLALLMGVKVEVVETPFQVSLSEVTQETPPAGKVLWGKQKTAKFGFVIDHAPNNSLIAMNRLQKLGYEIAWARKEVRIADSTLAPGAILVMPPPPKQRKPFEQDVQKIARDLSLTIHALPKGMDFEMISLKKPRVGIYKSWVPTMDEGWTRFVFEKFEQPYESIYDLDIRQGGLNNRFDIIVLPQQSVKAIVDGNAPKTYPDQYVGGLGQSGVTQLKAFVAEGGTLVALDTAADFVIEKMGVNVTNAVQGLKSSDFYCPGSIVAAETNPSSPIAYGMTRTFSALYENSRAFETKSGRIAATYRSQDPLQSGWLIGPQYLAGKPAIVDLDYGTGKVILLGFRTQFRGWTDGTFKLLFNSLFYGSATAITSRSRKPK
jgi:hypothetical protein